MASSSRTRDLPVVLPFGKRMLLRVAAITLVVAAAASYLALRDSIGVKETVSPHDLTSPVAQPNPNAARAVSDLEIPARSVLRAGTVDTPLVEGSRERRALELNQPTAFVPAGDRYYALDAGNSRLVEFDQSGQAVAALDRSADPKLSLHSPMSMAVHEGRLYIADTEAARVVVFDPTAKKVEQIITLEKQGEQEALPRPTGIAVAPNGDVFISDSNNQRILKWQADGTVASFAGTGKRDAGNRGLNAPGGLALDRDGNVYVVDILNSRVVKYSPDGQFLLQFGRPGDTAGSFSRPKGVAVDEQDTVYVSDSLQAAVQAFNAKGTYIGLIGRLEPGNKDSASMFKAPAELSIFDGRLFVTDRLAGPFVFELGR